MNNVTGFSVSSNMVTGASAAYQNNYGVIIDNCGSAIGNLVKGNTLKNLYTGIFARGLNGNAGNGVKFKCNIFQPSMAYQLSIEIGSSLSLQGTACVLGSTTDNTFFPPGVALRQPDQRAASFCVLFRLGHHAH